MKRADVDKLNEYIAKFKNDPALGASVRQMAQLAEQLVTEVKEDLDASNLIEEPKPWPVDVWAHIERDIPSPFKWNNETSVAARSHSMDWRKGFNYYHDRMRDVLAKIKAERPQVDLHTVVHELEMMADGNPDDGRAWKLHAKYADMLNDAKRGIPPVTDESAANQ